MVAKYAAVAPVLDERSRRVWAATEAVALGYGGDALVSAATGLARATIRKGQQGHCQLFTTVRFGKIGPSLQHPFLPEPRDHWSHVRTRDAVLL